METIPFFSMLKDPEVHEDPYPFYARLRDTGRVLPTDQGGWVVPHHAECAAVLRDNRFSANSKHQNNFEQFAQLAEAVGLSDLLDMFGRLILFADPPDHTRLRRIASKAFTVRAVEAMRPRIAAIVGDMLDTVAGNDSMELVESLAFPLPVTVISDMLGVPAADHDLLRGWTSEAVKALDPIDDPMVLFPAAEALRNMAAYFDELVKERRRHLGPDLLSAFIEAEDDGDRLSHEELLDTTILLFGAGHETTVNLIAGGASNLLRHPEQLQRLRDEPTLMPEATEELLRFGPPVQMTGRIATVDIELDGQLIPKGTEVIVMVASANRDPEVFNEPESLDIGRSANRHLSFSGGIHFCLGAPLARIEAQEALGQLLDRFPKLSLSDPEVEWKPTTTIRGPKELHLTW
ncbi:MAG TPA: cytochrome P450 [Acidimicrobiales bacterium]|jgi:cytochrome P450